jgi:hypothetical protein
MELIMKNQLSLMVLPLFVLASPLATAGSMTCGTHMIQDDQIPGQSREEIEEKCGVPESSHGNNIYYKKGNVTYRLHFNDGNELETIAEEAE